jgi:hypothetical protein
MAEKKAAREAQELEEYERQQEVCSNFIFLSSNLILFLIQLSFFLHYHM